jgi:hypothetical protein
MYIIRLDDTSACYYVPHSYGGDPGSAAEEEGQYMFTPYSIFKVTKVDFSEPNPTPENPYKVWLNAAADAPGETVDLPLATWFG